VIARQVVPGPLPQLPPARPWLWSQRWLNPLFAHWQVPAAALRPHVPAGLELDTWQGTAWVTVVAFRLARVRRRWFPPLGPVSNFPELNLRTYVVYRGEPAIYFLSIHAGKRLVVRLARRVTPLPYAHAHMTWSERDGTWRFESRCQAAAGNGHAFAATFAPHSSRRCSRPGSLDAWLLERYTLYADDGRATLFRTEVRHAAWEVQDVAATIAVNTLGTPFGLDLSGPPAAAHFSPGVRALVWPFEVVEGQKGGSGQAAGATASAEVQ